MMRTLLLLVCMVLGSTLELAGTLQTNRRTLRRDAQTQPMASTTAGGACAVESGCTSSDGVGASCRTASTRREWRCGCCRTKTPVTLTLLRFAPLPVDSQLLPPTEHVAIWSATTRALHTHIPALESPPPRA